MLVVDAVVDDRDLDAGPERARQPAELRCADDGGARVERRRVAELGIHVLGDAQPQELGRLWYGRLTVKPFSRTRYLRETTASGISARRLAIARCWAASSRAR